jgi:hypothetical protein
MFEQVGARFWSRVILASAFLAATLLGARDLSAAEEVVGEIIIQAAALQPQVLMTEPEHKVLFVNRSGKMVHIQFLMHNGGKHHIFQVPEQIWAIFHQSGIHRYVVHFPDPKMPNLDGAVEVVGDPYGRPDPLVCGGVTVQGDCIER